MQTCPVCELAMTRNTTSGAVEFFCHCGQRVAGAPRDARLAGQALNEGENIELYRNLIANAAHSRIDTHVMRDCAACGLDYMTRIRVGARETIVYTCKCGHRES